MNPVCTVAADSKLPYLPGRRPRYANGLTQKKLTCGFTFNLNSFRSGCTKQIRAINHYFLLHYLPVP
ncbi:MAG: hypothetical protein F6K56_09895 [Moorea sp. SIO3G5]|nr:hypothetical protein [Moorena sp. SIO3G5]